VPTSLDPLGADLWGSPGDCRARLAVLVESTTAAGGKKVGGVALLSPLRPHHGRRLAESELRPVLRRMGIGQHDDAALALFAKAVP
jgi:hypothetical protein